MSELVNIVVAIAFIALIVNWATSSKETPEEKNARAALGFRPKHVTSEMLDTISSMFPDMPIDNIRYDLLRTGNVETTTNKIIENGFLQAPPAAYYRVYPRAEAAPQSSGRVASSSSSTPGAGPSNLNRPTVVTGLSQTKGPSLIEKYQLQSRLDVSESDTGVSSSSSTVMRPEDAGGKAAWEATAAAREASLRERKAQMILAARRRLMEEEKQAS